MADDLTARRDLIASKVKAGILPEISLKDYKVPAELLQRALGGGKDALNAGVQRPKSAGS